MYCQVEKEKLEKGGESLRKKGAKIGTLFSDF